MTGGTPLVQPEDVRHPSEPALPASLAPSLEGVPIAAFHDRHFATKEQYMNDLKTTLAGLASAGLNLYANGTAPKQIVFSIGIALLGSLASDATKRAAKLK